MYPRDIEQAVFELEEVRIAIQATSDIEMGDYNFQRKAAGNISIREWLDQRVYPLVGDYGVAVYDGYGGEPHRRTNMENLRASYLR